MRNIDGSSVRDNERVISIEILNKLFLKFFAIILTSLVSWSSLAGWIFYFIIMQKEDSLVSNVFFALRELLRPYNNFRWVCFITTLLNLVVLMLLRKKTTIKTPIILFLSLVGIAINGILSNYHIINYLYYFLPSLGFLFTICLLLFFCLKKEAKIRGLFRLSLKEVLFPKNLDSFWVYFSIFGIGSAIILRFLVALLAPLSYDEVFSYLNYSQLGPIVSLIRYDFPNNHILYSLLDSIILWPNAPIILVRVLPFIFGIVGILAAFIFIKVLFDIKTAAIAALFIGFNPALFCIGTNGRGYSISIGFCIIAMLFLALAKYKNIPEFYSIGIFCLALSTMVLPSWLLTGLITGIFAMLILFPENRIIQLKAWAIAGVSVLLFLFPAGLFLKIFWQHSWLATAKLSETSIIDTFKSFLFFIFLPFNSTTKELDITLLIIISLSVFLSIVGIFYAYKRGVVQRWFSAITLSSFLFLIFGLGIRPGDSIFRQFLQFLPFILMSISITIAIFRKKIVFVMVILFLTFIPLFKNNLSHTGIVTKETEDMGEFINKALDNRSAFVSYFPYTMTTFLKLDIKNRYHLFDIPLIKFSKRLTWEKIWLLVEKNDLNKLWEKYLSEFQNQDYELRFLKENNELRLYLAERKKNKNIEFHIMH